MDDENYAKDDPLQFLLDVMNKSDDMFMRVNAAKAALPLGLHRFDADQIEFQFLGAQITQVTVPIVELSP